MRIRIALSLLAGVLALYFAARGLIQPIPHETPLLGIVAVAMFLAATALALAVPSSPAADAVVRGPGRMPLWSALLASAAAVALPFLATAGARADESMGAPHMTWFIGAGGVVLTVVCARRRVLCAAIGILGLAIGTSIVLESVEMAFVAGILGSILWVGVAWLVVLFTDRAHRDTDRLVAIQHESAAWRAAQESRRRERRTRVQFAIAEAGPVLIRAIETSGALTAEEREQALVAEATLRDELRGAKLLDDAVRAALRDRRLAGSAVTLFDEGDLDDLDESDLARVRGELADVLGGLRSPQIIVRTARLPGTAVTVVGRGEGDDVELWREIPRAAG
ncbi:hypothetical protein [Microbacterium karelineae]|uniref:hypothetical protein n=1 Tax=Microbacterium karelineae TaxID=2654283 RepID=UPI0012EAC97E|nr:hypothetical protein [Microbacterium karelineae]